MLHYQLGSSYEWILAAVHSAHVGPCSPLAIWEIFVFLDRVILAQPARQRPNDRILGALRW